MSDIEDFKPPTLSEFSRNILGDSSRHTSPSVTQNFVRSSAANTQSEQKESSNIKIDRKKDKENIQGQQDLNEYTSGISHNKLKHRVQRLSETGLNRVLACSTTQSAREPLKITIDHGKQEALPAVPQVSKNTITIKGKTYTRQELLGTGGSSKVYKVTDETGRVYALKRVILHEVDPEIVAGFKGEINLLQRLKDQSRVVQLVDYELYDHLIILIMEKGEMDLRKVLDARQDTGLDVPFVRYFASEILKCVEAVHSYDIVHSDLKPANFLVVNGRLKLIDFGIANLVPEYTANIHRNTQVGTISYMAPETLLEHTTSSMGSSKYKMGKPSDIWSCGCLIYEMVYGKVPFKVYAKKQILAIQDSSIQIDYPARCPKGVKVPPSLKELIQGCLMRDPEKRIKAQDALDGVFLNPRSIDFRFVNDLVKKAVEYGHSAPDKTYLEAKNVDKLALSVWERVIHLNEG